MKKPSNKEQLSQLRNKIIGLGEKSIRKSYYPELQLRVEELEKANQDLQREIASRKEAEAKKEKLEEQLRQAMKMEAIGTLAGGIAHDFNNLLTVIIGYSELAKLKSEQMCKEGECSVTQDMERLLEAGHRAKELVGHILTFSRQQKQEKSPLLLGELIKETLGMVRISLPRSIEIQQDLGKESEPVLADATQINQIIMNLCTNSYHAMSEGEGVIQVALRTVELGPDDIRVAKLCLTPGKFSVLEISDNGQGMTRETMGRIFDPYFTTKSESGGTGMGLAVVHGIVREHGGHISVYSEPGEGTTFRVYLPQVMANVPKDVKGQKLELPCGEGRILLVDDEKDVLELEKQLLERLGYAVTPCLNSEEVMGVLEEENYAYDLVMTDMTMPKKNGVELTRQILKQKPDMPVIICTGFSELVSREKALAIGARNYVMKPLVLNEIAEILRNALEGNNGSEPDRPL